MAQPIENQTLYDLGRGYARRVARRLASTWDALTAIREIAVKDSKGVAEVRTAYLFSKAVDAIASVVPGARATILDASNPHLTPAIVIQLSKRPGPTIKSAMRRAALGLHPLAPKPPDWLSADQVPWHFDLSRLREAADLMRRVYSVVVCPRESLGSTEIADLAVHTAGVRLSIDALRLVLGRGRETRARPAQPVTSKERDRADVVALAKRARGLVEGATGDLLRAAYTRPVDSVRAELAQAVRDLKWVTSSVAEALPDTTIGVSGPTVVSTPGGPDASGGTYVVMFHADTADLVPLGRLGTFWLPAGYLLYVGSAFAGGGVKKRTDRHLNGSGPRLWNVDHLQGFARPVELWWSHNSERVECTWAMALAAMPACCCPAPRAGANDCKRCPSHLFRTASRPSCKAFAEHLGRFGSGSYTISFREVAS